MAAVPFPRRPSGAARTTSPNQIIRRRFTPETDSARLGRDDAALKCLRVARLATDPDSAARFEKKPAAKPAKGASMPGHPLPTLSLPKGSIQWDGSGSGSQLLKCNAKQGMAFIYTGLIHACPL
ncbi:hypothetical protein SKAU_G00036910 [Synaphobranchus kaupii]|uniref:Uncharacterized protein n=1 Tax=Synaphobranchus kaupii TaxID=118154 RepID=A0A9Q1GG45_SYNKA|nr:hypothetical protein SKAU_G00036910 [Synaphobranchus kaupii]